MVEFQVIVCAFCHHFQVHQVKKSPKWACKLCGEKQSLKGNYFQGEAKECRERVMKLNFKRGQEENKAKQQQNKYERESKTETSEHGFNSASSQIYKTDSLNNKETNNSTSETQVSKWDKFLPPKTVDKLDTNDSYIFK